MSPPRSRLLGGWPTLMCQVLTTRARDQGTRPPPSWLAQTLDKDLQAPAPTWPPTPGSLPSHAAPAHRSAASTSPTAATKDSSAPCSCPPSPPCAPPRLPGLLPTQTRPRQNALGQAVLTQAHRRLTHHTGAPPFRTGRHSTHRLHDTHSSSDHPLDRRPRRPLSSGGQSEPEAHAPHFEGSALEECPGHLSSRPFPRAPGATHRQGD